MLQNFDNFLIPLRSETWLTVMLTVAAVGCAVAVTVACYISCKSCSEVVEGSQVRLTKIRL